MGKSQKGEKERLIFFRRGACVNHDVPTKTMKEGTNKNFIQNGV